MAFSEIGDRGMIIPKPKDGRSFSRSADTLLFPADENKLILV